MSGADPIRIIRRASLTIRRWCPTCSAVTASWVDGRFEERCARCDPESTTYPGTGVNDWAEDE